MKATIAPLAKIKETATEGDAKTQYLVLKQHVYNRLQERAGSDPEATEALEAMRPLSVGR